MTDFTHPVFLGLMGFGFMIFIAVIYWIEYKKSQHGQKKMDPVSKGLILSGLLIMVFFVAESVGYLEKGFNQQYFWVHILIAIIIVSIFLFVAYSKRPLPYKKQKQIVKDLIDQEYQAESYIGGAFAPWLVVYKMTVKRGSESNQAGEVGNFLALAQLKKLMYIWVQINIYTGHVTHLQIDPPQELLTRLMGEDIPVADKFAEAFEDDNTTTNTQQPTAVQA